MLESAHVQACLKLVRDHLDDPEENLEIVIGSDETKICFFLGSILLRTSPFIYVLCRQKLFLDYYLAHLKLNPDVLK